MNTLRAHFEHTELERLRRELANEKAMRLAAEAARDVAQEKVRRLEHPPGGGYEPGGAYDFSGTARAYRDK